MIPLFKSLTSLDKILIGVVLVALLGVVAVKKGWHKTSGGRVLGKTAIQVTVLLSNVRSLTPTLITAGKPMSITIRNQPRGEVSVLSAQWTPKPIAVPNGHGGVVALPDPSLRYAYDVVVQLKDEALESPEGFVAEGIKVKAGLPIELEGFDYRLNGVIVGVNKLKQ